MIKHNNMKTFQEKLKYEEMTLGK
jgi:hypothetical protein